MFTKLVTALALCAAASGCVVPEEDSTPPAMAAGYGTLSTYWTLDGAVDADACTYYGVDRAEVVVFDEDGYQVAEAEPFCETFGAMFELRNGWYSTEVTLLDMDGFALSDTVVVEVRVMRATKVFVDVDFPDSTIR